MAVTKEKQGEFRSSSSLWGATGADAVHFHIIIWPMCYVGILFLATSMGTHSVTHTPRRSRPFLDVNIGGYIQSGALIPMPGEAYTPPALSYMYLQKKKRWAVPMCTYMA